MTAGYSGTPLAAKLGITAGTTLAVIHDPGDFLDLVAPLPEGVEVRRSLRGHGDIAAFFTEHRSELERRIDVLGRFTHPDGAFWVCWPKQASKVPTDMSGNVVRDVVLPRGLVDVKIAAIDATWSGLKVVWRKENR